MEIYYVLPLGAISGGPLGALLGLLGSFLGRLEAILGRLGALLTALKPLSRS